MLHYILDGSLMVSTLVLESIPRFLILNDDWIKICVNDEHPEKALFPIEVTEEGIVICVNDEHP